MARFLLSMECNGLDWIGMEWNKIQYNKIKQNKTKCTHLLWSILNVNKRKYTGFFFISCWIFLNNTISCTLLC